MMILVVSQLMYFGHQDTFDSDAAVGQNRL